MANPQIITFYDIASGPPVRPFAPNPWKTRYALNFKRKHSGLQYETCWVDLSQVTEVRKRLGALPVRKHLHDDSDFYTLPVVVDHATGQTVGDSFDIAVHLDKTYPPGPPPPSPPHPHPRPHPHPSAPAAPEGGQAPHGHPNPDPNPAHPAHPAHPANPDPDPVPAKLFPDGTLALHRAFNMLADTIFPEHALLVLDVPFNPATEAVVKEAFCRRVGKDRWEDLFVAGPAREALLGRFEARLGELAKLFVRRDEGPFLEGATPMYADMIVGGWLQWLKGACPEWERIRTWHDGLWGKLEEGLSVYAQTD